MQFSHTLVDIELTNRCNALCSFCPRDKTPEQGFISEEDFAAALERVLELPEPPKVTMTGQGEPTLHPGIVDFTRRLTAAGLRAGTTSNASLMSPQLAEDLLSAGLKEISFSISDFGDDYEEVYNLDFENSLANALHFIAINNGRCEITVNIVEHDINRGKIEEMKAFWREHGVDSFIVFGQNNRGGACENGKLFAGVSDMRLEAQALMRAQQVSTLCAAAFKFLFVGWNGNYYICCNDYEKTTPLGHVSELGFGDLNQTKLELLACGGIDACRECDLDPTNRVREVMLERQHGLASDQDLAATLSALHRSQQKYPGMHSDLDWDKHLRREDDLIARER